MSKPEEVKPAEEIKPAEPKPEEPKKVVGGRVQLQDKAKELLLNYERQGKIKIDEKLPENIVTDIALQIGGSKASVFLARNKILAERATPQPKPAEVRISVTPQPKPMPQPAGVAPAVPTKPLELDMETILGSVNELLPEAGIQALSDKEIALLSSVWEAALGNVQVRQETAPVVMSQKTVLAIAALITLAFVGVRILTMKPKPKEEPKPKEAKPTETKKDEVEKA